jgi:hypothetical protein
MAEHYKTRDEALLELEVVANKRKKGYLDGGDDYKSLAVIWGFLALLIQAIRKAPF